MDQFRRRPYVYAIAAAIVMMGVLVYASSAQAKVRQGNVFASFNYTQDQYHGAHSSQYSDENYNVVNCTGKCARITTHRDRKGRYHKVRLLSGQKLVEASYTYVSPDGTSWHTYSNWNGRKKVRVVKEVIDLDTGEREIWVLSTLYATIRDPKVPMPRPTVDPLDKGGCIDNCSMK